MSKPILITGATGNQGGAVLDALINLNSKDFTLIALTRNANSPAAKRITSKSKAVHILTGDLNKPEAIFTDAEKLTGTPIWGVFMVQSVIAGGVTAAQEETQGKTLISTSIAHNVKTLIYSSIDRGGPLNSPTDPTPVSVFASKHNIEQHLFTTTQNTETKYLVLRPTGLLEPLVRDDFVARLSQTAWRIYMRADKPIQWVSVRDIGYFAAWGFRDPERWAGECLSLAGWEGTFADADAIYRRVMGRGFSLTFGLLVRFVCGVLIPDLGRSYGWYDSKGFGADVEGLRRMYPGLRGLEDVLREMKTEGERERERERERAGK